MVTKKVVVQGHLIQCYADLILPIPMASNHCPLVVSLGHGVDLAPLRWDHGHERLGSKHRDTILLDPR